MTDVSRILHSAEQGDPRAVERLLPLVYNELRQMAQQHLAGERPGQTLQATALVHEAYLRLVGDRGEDAVHWQNRRHFFGAAAEAMRRILIDATRRRQTQKRGGGAAARRDVEPDDIAAPERSDELLALDEALEKLAATDTRAAELVKLRYFAGLSLPESAKVLDISPRSADRLWAYARAWLHRQITQET